MAKAPKNTDRKQNIFLSLLMLHNASPNYFYNFIILHEQKRFKIYHKILMLYARFFTKSTPKKCYDRNKQSSVQYTAFTLCPQQAQ